MYDDLFLFIKIARFKSFTKASKELGIYQSTLSRRILNLEKELKAKLFDRTSNHFALTQQGSALYEALSNSENILQNQIISALNNDSLISGELTIMLPQVLSLAKVTPFIPSFIASHPHLKLRIFYHNHAINLKQDAIDLAVIYGMPGQTSQKVKLIYRAQLTAICSPLYIEKYGHPEVNNLGKHRVVGVLRDHGEIIDRAVICNIHSGESVEIRVDCQLAANSFLHTLQLVDSGEFIMVTFKDILHDYLQSGRYVTVLNDYAFKELDFYLVKRVDDDPRINIFAAFIEECFSKR